MKYGILPDITEKKIYFADVGILVDYKYDLQEEKQKLIDFFEKYVLGYDPEDDLQSKIYREMIQEYERIEHLLQNTERRLGNV